MPRRTLLAAPKLQCREAGAPETFSFDNPAIYDKLFNFNYTGSAAIFAVRPIEPKRYRKGEENESSGE
jgi:hypothetical protein